MKLQELKTQIINKIGDMYDEQFVTDVNKCGSGWDLLYTLEKYGYDKQGGLDVLFSILID